MNLRCLILVVLALAGCDRGNPPTPAGRAQPPASAPIGNVIPAVPDSERNTLTIAGTQRTYIAHVPRASMGRRAALPLVIFLHGAGDDAGYAYQAYGFPEMSDREGLIVVFPDGLLKRWDALGTVRGKSDDEAFLSELISEIRRTHSVDPRRIYLCGHSNGAMMTAAFAAKHSDQIAAIGLVAGAAGWETAHTRITVARPSRPLPVMIVHGMRDPNLPFAPPPPHDDLQALGPQASAEFWAAANGCDLAPHAETLADGRVLYTAYARKDDGDAVVAYFLTEGNHMWPGARAMTGKTQIPSSDMATTEVMWAFFQRHPLPVK